MKNEKGIFEQLNKSEKIHNLIFDNSPVGLVLVDSITRQFYAFNSKFSEILGRTEEELKRIDWTSITHPDDLESDLEKMEDINSGKINEYSMKKRFFKSDNSIVWVNMTIVKICDGGKHQHLCAVEDITKTKKLEADNLLMEARLRNQQKLEAIGTLAGGIAHEINNPINGIINYSQLIIDLVKEGEDPTEYAKEITIEANRIANIVKNLLQFSRKETHEHHYVKIEDIINNTLSLIHTVILNDKIELCVDLPSELPLVNCQSQQIQQVIMNLITNARDALNEKYCEDNINKKIELSCNGFNINEEDWIRLIVEDNGMGISKNIRENIFDPFYTTKDRTKGTGLGLYICNNIIKKHNGKLTFDTKEGEYTKFYIDLPVNQ